MVQKIQKILQDQSGAAMIIVLVFFVIAMAVGASLLVASSTAGGNAANALYEQQAYFSAKSAGQMLQAELAKIVITVTKTTVSAASGSTTTRTVTGNDVSLPFYPMAYDAVTAALEGSSSTYDFTLSGVEDMGDVSVNLTAGRDYLLRGLITTEYQDYSYLLHADFDPVVSSDTQVSATGSTAEGNLVTTTVVTTTIRWSLNAFYPQP